MRQHMPTWSQLEANIYAKIIEKPLFFPGFSNIFKKSLESFGKALGDSLGMPWGAFGDAWGGFGAALGSFGAALGGLGDALGALLGKPALEDLGKAWKDPPRNHVRAKTSKSLTPILL